MDTYEMLQDLKDFWNNQRSNRHQNYIAEDFSYAIKSALLQLSVEQCKTAITATVCYTVDQGIVTRKSIVTFKNNYSAMPIAEIEVSENQLGYLFFVKEHLEKFINSLRDENVKKRFDITPKVHEEEYKNFFDNTQNCLKELYVTMYVP